MDALDWMHVSEIVEGQINVKILPTGKKAIVLRRGNEISVFAEVCPHLGADLSQGWYCAPDMTLRCKWHGYLFATDDGRMLENPNEVLMPLLREPSPHFQPGKAPRYRLSTIPHVVADDRLYFLKHEAVR